MKNPHSVDKNSLHYCKQFVRKKRRELNIVTPSPFMINTIFMKKMIQKIYERNYIEG